jgi:hypothetical protein
LSTQRRNGRKIRGTDSGLHVVIFDEIDSIAKPRGSLIGR